MGLLTKVTCDGCGRDLTTRTNSVDYRLVLGSESKSGRGSGVYTDMMIYPSVDRDYYFCYLGCLDHWRDHERHLNRLWRALDDEWRDKYGVVYNEHSSMCPSKPKWLLEAAESMFHAEAGELFPLEDKNA